MNPALIVWPVLISATGLTLYGAAGKADRLLDRIAADVRLTVGWVLAMARWAWPATRLLYPVALSAFASGFGRLRRAARTLTRRAARTGAAA